MGPGGKRPGAGRPKGSKSKTTLEREAATRAAAEAVAAAVGDAFEGDAHALLMLVYKDPTQDLPLRIDAAKAAIRFEKPVLSSVEAKVGISYDDLTEEELDAEIAREAIAAGLAAAPETIQ